MQLPLTKFVTAAGERRVSVDARTDCPRTPLFRLLRAYPGFALLEAELKTGRTHQIRVHLHIWASRSPGTTSTGISPSTALARAQGLKRMFLHAFAVEFDAPGDRGAAALEAPLPADLQRFLEALTSPADTVSR